MRYALYFSPARSHPMTGAATRWLGRDAFTDERQELPDVPGLDADTVKALTADARRYGFHATLKAPFSLADGRTEAELIGAIEAFVETQTEFDIPNLVLGQLGRFFALVPEQPYAELQEFAASVVRHFEPFRAPLSADDMARRKPERLTPSERASLEQWGYPYVFEDFRFHMTLSAQVPDEATEAMRAALTARFSDFTDQPLSIDSLTLFVEPSRGADFTVLGQFPLLARDLSRKTA